MSNELTVQRRASATPRRLGPLCALSLLSWLAASPALAHGVAHGDADFVSQGEGARVLAFVYLGAKHMVTGYDHLLFLAGVVFFLRSMRQVAGYVTLFALGHSLTLISFTMLSWRVDAIAIDALIALSVVYKALENLGAFRAPIRPDPRLAVFGFGLIHGMGLASKLQSLRLSADGLLENLLAFNAGVELGQLCALSVLVLLLSALRRLSSFGRFAALTNQALLMLGFLLVEYQLATLFLRGST